jgi:hypothetical protein
MHADKDSEIGAISAIGPFAAPPPTKYAAAGPGEDGRLAGGPTPVIIPARAAR